MAKKKKVAKKTTRKRKPAKKKSDILQSLRIPFVVGISSGIGSAIAAEAISLFNKKE